MALRLWSRQLANNLIIKTQCSRNISSTKPEDTIVITDDASTIVCWHPKPSVPYELTKPITLEPIKDSNSILKHSWDDELKQMFKKKNADAARQELMALTHTTKHRWYPRSRDRRAKKTLMDREYL